MCAGKSAVIEVWVIVFAFCSSCWTSPFAAQLTAHLQYCERRHNTIEFSRWAFWLRPLDNVCAFLWAKTSTTSLMGRSRASSMQYTRSTSRLISNALFRISPQYCDSISFECLLAVPMHLKKNTKNVSLGTGSLYTRWNDRYEIFACDYLTVALFMCSTSHVHNDVCGLWTYPFTRFTCWERNKFMNGPRRHARARCRFVSSQPLIERIEFFHHQQFDRILK